MFSFDFTYLKVLNVLDIEGRSGSHRAQIINFNTFV